MGRPRKELKEVNPVRQVGRWPERDWEIIRRAAKKMKLSVAEWARRVLLRAAGDKRYEDEREK